MPSEAVIEVARRLQRARQRRGIEPVELEQRLILGPGWISAFESGDHLPSLDMLLAILSELDLSPSRFFSGLNPADSGIHAERMLHAEPDGEDVLLQFPYGQHDAIYRLTGASPDEVELIIGGLRDDLARLADPPPNESEAIKTDAVASAFLRSVRQWPQANPSDLWWFLVYRAYCDPFNHPAMFARLDLPQSWKRTAGWALEEVLVRFYADSLKQNKINLFIAQGNRKAALLSQVDIEGRLEADKVDVLLTGHRDGHEVCFGVVHVKSSFAERRTDDVPLSQALIAAGYASPLWTMDCKSTPAESPFNKGELGFTLEPEKDRRSAKRRDVEDDGYFSACFSYNQNTNPTPTGQEAAARVMVCDFRNPNDAFSEFVVRSWRNFRRREA